MNTKIIAYISLKGGTGKSSLAILTANYAAALGKKVLVIDLDLQNSASFYYHPEEPRPGFNVAAALQLSISPQQALLPTRKNNVALLASALSLADIRAIDEKRLMKILPQVSEGHDLIVIDTPPTYDNLVLNGIHAADLIYTPLNISQFDIKSALFLRDKFELDLPGKLEAWRPFINNLNRSHLTGAGGITAQYLSLCSSVFSALAPYSIPSRISIKKSIDGNKTIRFDDSDLFGQAFYAHMSGIIGTHTPPEEF
jgi:chromosome partitioning protein